MSRSSSLAKQTSISCKKLSQLPLVAYQSTNHPANFINLFLHKGISLNVKFTVNNVSLTNDLLSSGAAYALVTNSSFATMTNQDSFITVPIRDTITISTILLAHKTVGPLAISKAFIEIFEGDYTGSFIKRD